MEQRKFKALLILLIPEIATGIADRLGWDEMKAALKFYDSQVCEILEEETKLWHLSPMTICHMFEEEIKTGNLTFPKEVSQCVKKFRS